VFDSGPDASELLTHRHAQLVPLDSLLHRRSTVDLLDKMQYFVTMKTFYPLPLEDIIQKNIAEKVFFPYFYSLYTFIR